MSEPALQLVRRRPRTLGHDALVEDDGQQERERILDHEPVRARVLGEEGIPGRVGLRPHVLAVLEQRGDDGLFVEIGLRW